MTWAPNVPTEGEVEGFVEDLMAVTPEILGIDETLPGCEIIDMNPYGVPAGTLPRYIKVAIREYYQDVFYRGFPAGLVATDIVTVIHLREGNRYEILTAGGSTGIAHTVTAGQWLDIGAVANLLDFEPDNPAVVTAAGVVTEYATIQAAITAAGAGEYVVVPPGTYDEAITLKNGVIVTELFPDTVVINHTTSDVAVTTAAGGFLRVKEIRVTRANNNIRAVLSGHAAGICVIYARLIRAQNAGTGGTIGVFQTGAGTLFVYCDDCQASGGDDEVIGAACDAGIQYLRGDCLAENGTANYSIGAQCDGGTQRVWGDCRATDDGQVTGAYAVGAGDQIVWGHCTAETVAAGSKAVGAKVMNPGTVQVVYGDCSGLAVDDAIGAEDYQGTQTIHGNCSAECTGSPADSHGARVRADSVQTVWGNCTATGGTVSIGAYCQAWTGTPIQRVNGDVTGDFHGALCSAGTQTITNSRASGATADLEQTGGTLQAFSVQHDTVVGTITWLDGDALESLRDYAQGSLIYGGAADWQDLVVGAIGDFLWVNAAGTEPEWHTLVAGDIPAHALLGTQHSDTTTDAPTRGSLILANATPLWDELVHPAAAGYALTTDANDVVWDQTPTWTGEHSFEAGIAFTGASGANEITVPDNTAIALELLDAGGLEYMRIVSTDAQPATVFNFGEVDVDFRVAASGITDALFMQGSTGFVGAGRSTPEGHLDVYDITVNTTISYYGIHNEHVKTLGATDYLDVLEGIHNHIEFDQNGAEIGYFTGVNNRTILTSGSVGDGGARDMMGIYNHLWMEDATCTVTGDVLGIYTYVDLNGGIVGDNVMGHSIYMHLRAGLTSIFSDVFGIKLYLDADTAPAGTVYSVYWEEGTNVDYGIYQSGTAPNLFGGHVDPASASGQDLGDATHRWDLYTQDVIFGGATGANAITVPDNIADALHVSDTGGLEYVRIVSTDANPYVLIDPAAADILVGIGVAAAPLAKTHIDNVGTVAQPVLLLDQGDVSEQCVHFSSDAVDRDINLYTINVTGTPKMWWDESQDALTWDKCFNIEGYSGNQVILDVDAVTSQIRGITLQPRVTSAVSGSAGITIGPDMRPGGNVAVSYGQLNVIQLSNSANNVTSMQAVFYRLGTAASYTGTLTNVHVLRIADSIFTGSQATNVYGLYIEAINSGSGANYAIYSTGGVNYFGDNICIGATAAGGNAVRTLALSNTATPPINSANLVHLYAEDISASAVFACWAETAPAVISAYSPSHTWLVRLNGVSYRIQLDAV